MVLLPRRVNCSGKHESKPFDAASWPAAGASADQTAPDVYQVDYDHSTGTFTQPEKLETSDNIIVCGLHSLYSNNDDMYNMKIFIDI
mgnify:CR=1 FL=1